MRTQSAGRHRMYVVIGATGHTGSVVAEKLLAKGEKVRVVGRDARRLEGLKQKGAEAFVADVTDGSAMARAFSGAEAAYVMVPPNISSPNVRSYQEHVNDVLARALQNNGVRHAVVLSSVGADKPDRTGPVLGLHTLEQLLEAIAGLNVLFLRAGYFMENILPQVSVIQSLGHMAGPIRSDLGLPMIATRDIGVFAAEALSRRDFQGKQRRELLGARDVTYAQVAKVVGAAIEKPDLSYRQVPAAQLKPALTQMGMSPNMADLLLEMSDALNSGHMRALEPRSQQNTTATTIETFVGEVFVPAYRAKAARA
ncbi:MAG: epimerase [Acidobacteria bacterium]|nr:MAG: epimerase [Acidobacteriota bacterium]